MYYNVVCRVFCNRCGRDDARIMYSIYVVFQEIIYAHTCSCGTFSSVGFKRDRWHLTPWGESGFLHKTDFSRTSLLALRAFFQESVRACTIK